MQEEEEERGFRRRSCLFVFNDSVEGSRTPAVKPGLVWAALHELCLVLALNAAVG